MRFLIALPLIKVGSVSAYCRKHYRMYYNALCKTDNIMDSSRITARLGQSVLHTSDTCHLPIDFLLDAIELLFWSLWRCLPLSYKSLAMSTRAMESFWALHRRLGELHEAELSLARLQEGPSSKPFVLEASGSGRGRDGKRFFVRKEVTSLQCSFIRIFTWVHMIHWEAFQRRCPYNSLSHSKKWYIMIYHYSEENNTQPHSEMHDAMSKR